MRGTVKTPLTVVTSSSVTTAPAQLELYWAAVIFVPFAATELWHNPDEREVSGRLNGLIDR